LGAVAFSNRVQARSDGAENAVGAALPAARQARSAKRSVR